MTEGIKPVHILHREEELVLSPLAVRSSESGGRVHPEPEHEYRTAFMRDRDRIVHSKSFKRLEYKTQVFIYSEGDHYRNRLTHTLEVAGISRTIASALGLNSFLAESIALAHDLGHAPFGHSGQDVLSGLMAGYGGFEHNKQSLRIVQKLEKKYPEFPGLNLSRETLKGIMKHGADYEISDLKESRNQGPALEALITDFADEIAYNTHDMEDGIESGLINENDLADVAIWKKHYAEIKSRYSSADRELVNRAVFRSVMNDMVTDLMKSIAERLQGSGVSSRADFAGKWQDGFRPAGYSPEMALMVAELKKFLRVKLYKHQDVIRKSDKGKEIIEKLFTYFLNHTDKIPESFRSRLETDGNHRIVCDYVAGMTDRFAEITAATI